MLAAFGGLMAALLCFRRRCLPHPELLRKLLHLGMGLVTLALPWLFTSPGPVILLTGLFLFLLVSLRILSPLRNSLGCLIHDVQRKSFGDICFVLGVGSLFVFSFGKPLFFCIPLLILTLADAAAAMVGLRYGSWRSPSSPSGKSIEGSIAFFVVGFLTAHVGLLLFTDIGRAETLLIAATAAFLLALLEATTSHGLDNLIIPLAALALLKAYLAMDAPALAGHLSAAVVLLLFLFIAHRHIPFSYTAVLRITLLAYLIWAAGGASWLSLSLSLFLSHMGEVAEMLMAVVLALFGIGALLICVGNRVRGITPREAHALWVKYFTYAAIVTGITFCATRHTLLHVTLITLGTLCIWEVLKLRVYWAAVWVATSVWFSLHVPDFVAMYLVVAAADAFAQVGGRLLGGLRPWPKLSPEKTLSGTLCGIGVAAMVGYFLGIRPETAVALAVAGLVGDLVASKIKRSVGIKDFGRALPGHGGFMDRFDSLWGAAPVGALLW